MQQLTPKQIRELKALLETVGLSVKPVKSAGYGEGSPGKRPVWWHGNGSGNTRKMVAKFGYWKDARGVYDYERKSK